MIECWTLSKHFSPCLRGTLAGRRDSFLSMKKRSILRKRKVAPERNKEKIPYPRTKDINKKSRYRKTLALNLHPPNQIFPMCFRSREGGTVSSEHNLESMGPIPVIFFCRVNYVLGSCEH